MEKTRRKGRVDAALSAIVADGIFCLAFTVHIVGSPASSITTADYLCMAVILCVLVTACWAIHYEYWHTAGQNEVSVKTLRIKELSEGAAIEFDGKSYRVDNINRSKGEILIARVGQPGSIVVQIQGES